MNTMSDRHPESEDLIAFLEAPQSDKSRPVSRHLIQCNTCRKEVMALQATIDNLKNSPVIAVEKPTGEHPDEMTIADYIEKRLPQDRFQNIEQHVMGCNYCRKAALYYAMERSESQRKSVPGEEPADVRMDLPAFKNDRKTRPFEWLRGLFSWKMPIWTGVPATVLATAILFLILTNIEKKEVVTVSPPQVVKKEVMTVSSYQDKSQIIFKSSKGDVPGIGFFGAAREKAEPFSGLSFEIEDTESLKVKWPEVKGARLYEIRVYSLDRENREMIAKAGTSGKTEVLLYVSGLKPGKRYEWELSGTTGNGNRFLAEGGFVVGLEVRF